MWNSQQQLKQVLVETIQVLCKNSLPSDSSFCIEATIGITLSTDEVMVISFKERVRSDGSHLSLMIADEHESEQSQGKNKNNGSAYHSRLSFPHSSCSRSDVSHEDLISGNPAVPVYKQNDISQTYSGGNAVDGEVSVFDIGVIDGEEAASYMPRFGSTEISEGTGNQFHVPSPDRCAVAQSPSDHDNDTKDDVVILKVEDGNDSTCAVNGMSESQVGTELAAPPVQPRLYARKQKPRRDLSPARFAGNVEYGHLRQPTSMSFAANDMQQQHVGGLHQHNATFDAS